MGGLLDFLSTDEGRLGLGLLAAAGPRSDRMGFGGRVQEAMQGMDVRKQNDLKSKLLDVQMQESQARMLQGRQAEDRYQQTAMREKEARDRDQSIQAAYVRAQTPGQPALPQLMGDPELGIMPQPARPAVPAGFNAQQFANEVGGFNWKEGLAMQQALDQAARQASEKANAPVKLAPGESLFSGPSGGYKPLLSVPGKESELPSAVKEYSFAKGQGYDGSFVDFQLAQKKAGASSVSVSMTDGQKGFENEMKLGGAFKQEPIYKAHQDVTSAFDQVKSALSAGTPIGDIAGATKIMKILDPGSVVRESELGLAMSASGRLDRLQNYVKQAIDGTKLTETQRTDFGNLATELTAASAQAYNSKRSEYFTQGAEYNLNAGRALGRPVNVPEITKPSAGFSITAPNGKTYTFKTQGELNNFKLSTGAK